MPLSSRRVPARPLAVYRVLLGLVVLTRCAEAARILARLYDPTTYRVPWVSWMPALDWPTVVALLALWAVAGAAFTVGLYTRLAGTLLGVVMATVLLLDAQTYSNHLYLLAILIPLVGWAGGGDALSIDARRGSGADWLPAWPVSLVMSQVTAVYLFGALSKITPDNLAGNVIKYSLPRALLESVPHTAFVWIVIGSAVAVIASELFVAVGLWVSRYRTAAMGLAVLLHVGMIVLLGNVRVQILLFAAIMLGSFILWLDARPAGRTVVWDDTCSACSGWVRAFRRLDWLGAFTFVGSSDPAALARLGITREEADHAVQLVGPDGRSSGFGAVTGILELLPVTYLAAPFLHLPGIRHLGDAAYRGYAVRRHCTLPHVHVASAGSSSSLTE